MNDSEVVVRPDAQSVRATVEEHFPGLWPAVDLGLSVAATLLLKDNWNPVALIYMGGPGSSKTTVVDMIADEEIVVDDGNKTQPLVYVSDNFTPASLVSHAANVTKKTLEQIDLLPRIKHKLLITPELAPIFRGKPDDLVNTFKTITRVLDGHGLKTDSGTHGPRGYRGDYVFSWLGCTTPFDDTVWRLMAQLGSRLFFLVVNDGPKPTQDDMLATLRESPYIEGLNACRSVVSRFLFDLFQRNSGIRGIEWDRKGDSEMLNRWIVSAADLLAAMRSEPVKEAEPTSPGHGYVPAKYETPWRALSVLYNLARGHAVVHERRVLGVDDVRVITRVAVSSMPTHCARVFEALVRKTGKPLTTHEAQLALGVRHPETARKVMEDVAGRGVMDYRPGSPGQAATVVFSREWEWCGSGAFRNLLFGGPVTNPRMCAEPVTANLAQRQMEREVEGIYGGEDTHTPSGVTGDVWTQPLPLVLSDV